MSAEERESSKLWASTLQHKWQSKFDRSSCPKSERVCLECPCQLRISSWICCIALNLKRNLSVQSRLEQCFGLVFYLCVPLQFLILLYIHNALVSVHANRADACSMYEYRVECKRNIVLLVMTSNNTYLHHQNTIFYKIHVYKQKY